MQKQYGITLNLWKMIEKIDFSIIRYANCWEDADLLLDSLQVKANSHVLSIASAGDNSFSFLVNDGVKVMAVDISEVQILLCRFKKTAIQQLNCTEYLQLLGFMPCANKSNIIQKVYHSADKEVKQFMDINATMIQNGIGYAGKFEKYFKKFRTRILPFIHSKKTISELFEIKDEAAQKYFYNTKWNTFLWRSLLKLFFSKFILGRIGRDPEMLKEVDLNVGNYIREKSHLHLQSKACQSNYLLQMMLLGKFKNGVPFYLREENYNKIKNNIHNIKFHKVEIKDAPLIDGKLFHYFNMSNIFEYMNTQTFEATANTIKTKADSGAAIAYWNLMVKRDLSRLEGYLSQTITSDKIDNGFFYQSFNVSIKS
jgi:S-adenosylmethionine-diacylglycerol 3-amino-3-carboxypropyl transferase